MRNSTWKKCIFVVLALAVLLFIPFTEAAAQTNDLINEKGQHWSVPAGKQTYKIIQSENIWPRYTKAVIDPLKVSVGDTQKMSVEISSNTNILSVVAEIETDHGIKKVNLLRTATRSGFISTYTYEGSWVVQDTSTKTYRTKFIATKQDGKTRNITLAWSDPCAGVPVGGDGTLTGACAVSGVDGVDNGNLNLGSYTLTINAGARFVWNSGKQINMDTGSISIADTGSLNNTYLWMIDADNDGYSAYPSVQYASDTSPGGTYKRRYLLSANGNGTDCNDGNIAIYPGTSGGSTCSVCNADGTITAQTNAQDLFSECTTASPGQADSCKSATCSGSGYSCGYLAAGEQSQATCKRCSGSSYDPVNVNDNAQDTEGSNTCSATCQKCSSGACGNQAAGEDLFSQCGNIDCSAYIYGWGTGSPLSCMKESTTTDGKCVGTSAACKTQAQECTSNSVEGSQSGSAVCGSAECKNACTQYGATTSFDQVVEVCYTDGAQHSCSANNLCNSAGACKLANGQVCTLDGDCYSGNCDTDYTGTLRCHATASSCVIDASGAETADTAMYCSGYQYKICGTSVWASLLSCSNYLTCASTSACRGTCTSQSHCRSTSYYCTISGASCSGDLGSGTECSSVAYSGTDNEACVSSICVLDWDSAVTKYCTQGTDCINGPGDNRYANGWELCSANSWYKSCGASNTWGSQSDCDTTNDYCTAQGDAFGGYDLAETCSSAASGGCVATSCTACTNGYRATDTKNGCFSDCDANNDGKCIDGYYCRQSDVPDTCQAKLGNTVVCVEDSDCTSGNCDIDFSGSPAYCHATASSCVNDGGGSETATTAMYCPTPGYENKVCTNSVWGSLTACANNFACASTSACQSSCTSQTQCASTGYYCNTGGTACAADLANGNACDAYGATDDEACTSGNCDTNFDDATKYCHPTSTSCAYYGLGTPWERADGYEQCSGNSWYKSCATSAWGSQTNCDTTPDYQYSDANQCGWQTEAPDTCNSGASGGCSAPGWGAANDCGELYTTSTSSCNTDGNIAYCLVVCGATCTSGQTTDSGIDYCSAGASYNRIDICAISVQDCYWSDNGATSDTLIADCDEACGYYLDRSTSASCPGTACASCSSSCTVDGECDANAHCHSGTCQADHSTGTSCSGESGAACTSGNCVDGYCCNTACTGSTCQTCGAYSSGGAGTCGYVNSASQDPDNECAASYNGCSGDCTKTGPDGWCSGSGYSCKTSGLSTSVASGYVCSGGTEYATSATYYCSINYANVNNCQWKTQYRGCGGTGSCNGAYVDGATTTCGANTATQGKASCDAVNGANYCSGPACNGNCQYGYYGCAGSGSSCEGTLRSIANCGAGTACSGGTCGGGTYCNGAVACSTGTGDNYYNTGSINGYAYGQCDGSNSCDYAGAYSACGAGYDCTGGVCKLENGQTCTAGSECYSGNCYRDTDGDRYSVSGTMSCQANSALGSNDCEDGVASIWQAITGCADGDWDGYCGSSGQTSQCVGATESHNGRTYYYVWGGYYYWLAGAQILGYNDCNDGNVNIWVNRNCYLDSDSDGHYATSTTVVCSGSSCASGRESPAGDDCNDASGSVWANGYGLDNDRDTYGQSSYGCNNGNANYDATSGTDCNDGNGAVYVQKTCYPDGDSDGYYSASGTSVCANSACTSPAGYQNSAGNDCADGDWNTKPGQTGWFTSSGGNGWDYNCDSVTDYQYTATYGYCDNNNGCQLDDCCWDGAVGWQGTGNPGCGNSANYVDNPGDVCFGLACSAPWTTQGCH